MQFNKNYYFNAVFEGWWSANFLLHPIPNPIKQLFKNELYVEFGNWNCDQGWFKNGSTIKFNNNILIIMIAKILKNTIVITEETDEEEKKTLEMLEMLQHNTEVRENNDVHPNPSVGLFGEEEIKLYTALQKNFQKQMERDRWPMRRGRPVSPLFDTSQSPKRGETEDELMNTSEMEKEWNEDQSDKAGGETKDAFMDSEERSEQPTQPLNIEYNSGEDTANNSGNSSGWESSDSGSDNEMEMTTTTSTTIAHPLAPSPSGVRKGWAGLRGVRVGPQHSLKRGSDGLSPRHTPPKDIRVDRRLWNEGTLLTPLSTRRETPPTPQAKRRRIIGGKKSKRKKRRKKKKTKRKKKKRKKKTIKRRRKKNKKTKKERIKKKR
jgi:hypothetical protein